MAKKPAESIKKVAEMMRDIDFCMFTTASTEGGMYGRPMSNNGEVEFDGDIWFFSGADTRKIKEIKADPRVHLSYVDTQNFRFIAMSGEAEIVRDRDKKRELWLDELKRWFPDGPDSKDVVLIKVHPTLVAYWTGDGDGEIKLD